MTAEPKGAKRERVCRGARGNHAELPAHPATPCVRFATGSHRDAVPAAARDLSEPLALQRRGQRQQLGHRHDEGAAVARARAFLARAHIRQAGRSPVQATPCEDGVARRERLARSVAIAAAHEHLLGNGAVLRDNAVGAHPARARVGARVLGGGAALARVAEVAPRGLPRAEDACFEVHAHVVRDHEGPVDRL